VVKSLALYSRIIFGEGEGSPKIIRERHLHGVKLRGGERLSGRENCVAKRGNKVGPSS